MSLSKQNQLKGAKRYIALSFSVVYIKRINNTFLQFYLLLDYRHYTASNSAQKYVPGVSCYLLDTTKTHVNLLVLYIHIF